MELEVGMYARTKKYGIGKVTKLNGGRFTFKVNKKHYIPFDTDVIKASHNIIDLIEVGDILEINNEKYEVIYDESFKKLGILIPSRKEVTIRHSALEYVFKKYKVSIVTKEQFEAIAYKVV